MTRFRLFLDQSKKTPSSFTDMETCYKVFRREVIQSIPLEENRFGVEPEVTVKIAKRHLRVYEVGKKIGWKVVCVLFGAWPNMHQGGYGQAHCCGSNSQCRQMHPSDPINTKSDPINTKKRQKLLEITT
jgi:hypothetical protein